MNRSNVDLLRVPGASLYYKLRGTGQILLIIAGGVSSLVIIRLLQANHRASLTNCLKCWGIEP